MNTDIDQYEDINRSQEGSQNRKFWAIADLALMAVVLLSVREFGRHFEIIGSGSLGIVAAVLAGTLTMKIRGGFCRKMLY